jgi:hypothetical protein
MQSNLTILDRIALGQALPQSGKVADMRICQGIIDLIRVPAAELQPWLLPNGQLKEGCDSESTAMEIDFTDEQRQFIVATLRRLDEAGRIHLTMLGLCDAFLTEEE